MKTQENHNRNHWQNVQKLKNHQKSQKSQKLIKNKLMQFGDIISKPQDFLNFINNIDSKDSRKKYFLKKREKNYSIFNRILIYLIIN